MFCKSADDRNPRTSRIDLLTFKNGSAEFPDQKALDFLISTAAVAQKRAIEFYDATSQKLNQVQG